VFFSVFLSSGVCEADKRSKHAASYKVKLPLFFFWQLPVNVTYDFMKYKTNKVFSRQNFADDICVRFHGIKSFRSLYSKICQNRKSKNEFDFFAQSKFIIINKRQDKMLIRCP
jgi:hypothetical protein